MPQSTLVLFSSHLFSFLFWLNMNKLTSGTLCSKSTIWIILGLVVGWSTHTVCGKGPGFLFYKYPIPHTPMCVPFAHDKCAVHTICSLQCKFVNTRTDQTPFIRISPLIRHLNITAMSKCKKVSKLSISNSCYRLVKCSDLCISSNHLWVAPLWGPPQSFSSISQIYVSICRSLPPRWRFF